MIVKVDQFYWNGKAQLNQIEVHTYRNRYLVSYGEVVASKGADGVRLSYNWDCSRTTAKFVIRFLGRSTSRDVREKIESGEYKLVDKLVIE
jgi:hypothetical protein